jgi:hypothetical protein
MRRGGQEEEPTTEATDTPAGHTEAHADGIPSQMSPSTSTSVP